LPTSTPTHTNQPLTLLLGPSRTVAATTVACPLSAMPPVRSGRPFQSSHQSVLCHRITTITTTITTINLCSSLSRIARIIQISAAVPHRCLPIRRAALIRSRRRRLPLLRPTPHPQERTTISSSQLCPNPRKWLPPPILLLIR